MNCDGSVTLIDTGARGEISMRSCCRSVPECPWTADEMLLEWSDGPIGPTALSAASSGSSTGGGGLGTGTLSPQDPDPNGGGVVVGSAGFEPLDPVDRNNVVIGGVGGYAQW